MLRVRSCLSAHPRAVFWYALGAAAPLIFIGGVAFAPVPTGIDQPAMSLPLHLYLMLAQGTTIPQMYATAFVLMVLVLVGNVTFARCPLRFRGDLRVESSVKVGFSGCRGIAAV